jgi:hypothetical protein
MGIGDWGLGILLFKNFYFLYFMSSSLALPFIAKINIDIEATNNENIESKIKNSNYFNKAKNEINNIKNIIESKMIEFSEYEILLDSINIYNKLKEETKLNKISIESSIKLYYKYILFFIEKLKQAIKRAQSINNKKIAISLLDKRIIFEFFNNYEYNNSTKGNRFNKLMRILKIVFKNENVIFPIKLFIEKKK